MAGNTTSRVVTQEEEHAGSFYLARGKGVGEAKSRQKHVCITARERHRVGAGMKKDARCKKIVFPRKKNRDVVRGGRGLNALRPR